MEIINKVAVITGTSQGLGRAIALSFLKQGSKVYGLSRTEGDIKDENFKWIKTDITDLKSIKSSRNEVLKIENSVDILINNAGMWPLRGSLENIPEEQISQTIDLNLKGVIYMTKEFLPALTQSESYVVNISSQSGVRAMEGQTVYCASKFGVKGFTDTLKVDLRDKNIKVVGLYPDGMNTKMFEKGGETFSSDQFMNAEDMAEVVRFLVTRPSNMCLEEVWVKKFV